MSNISTHWEFCYERSLGCVGILHSMLTRAVHAALWADEKTFREKYLSRYALTEVACYAMMCEIDAAEKEMAIKPPPTKLRQMLGLKLQVVTKYESLSIRHRSILPGEKRQALHDLTE